MGLARAPFAYRGSGDRLTVGGREGVTVWADTIAKPAAHSAGNTTQRVSGLPASVWNRFMIRDMVNPPLS